jgi:hypothetical protein
MTTSSTRSHTHRGLSIVLAAVLSALAALVVRPAAAAELSLPLTLRFEVLDRALQHQLFTTAAGRTSVFRESDCRYLELWDPALSHHQGELRLLARGSAMLGVEVWDHCVGLPGWHGILEVRVRPYITDNWQLRFEPLGSALYDADGHKSRVVGPLWDLIQHAFLPRLAAFEYDLVPPREALLGVLAASLAPEHLERFGAVLGTVRARDVRVQETGAVVQLTWEMPDAWLATAPPPGTQVPDAPLSTQEINAFMRVLEPWDAFLIFIAKDLGHLAPQPALLDELFDLVLDSRHALLPILAGQRTAHAADPVRTLLIDSWTRLRAIVARAMAQDLLDDELLRYALFFEAGDFLFALDEAAPGLGIEISAAGLRRLARVIRPEAGDEAVRFDWAVDPVLRALFGFPPEQAAARSLAVSGASVGSSSPLDWLLRVAVAGEERLVTLSNRLDRWAPARRELPEYRPVIEALLGLITESELADNGVEGAHTTMFRPMMLATAMQESCWRQFRRTEGQVTYVASSAGSVGLMQINQHVWRGLYDVERLRWDAAYNTRAGAQILLQYMQRYGVREAERTGDPHNIPRASYAVYNAGPRAAARYRAAEATPREQRVDGRFWDLYRGFAAGGLADLWQCTTEPPER